eukprot:1392622-Amorphochlora_amoeboformis.AAC.1
MSHCMNTCRTCVNPTNGFPSPLHCTMAALCPAPVSDAFNRIGSKRYNYSCMFLTFVDVVRLRESEGSFRQPSTWYRESRAIGSSDRASEVIGKLMGKNPSIEGVKVGFDGVQYQVTYAHEGQ